MTLSGASPPSSASALPPLAPQVWLSEGMSVGLAKGSRFEVASLSSDTSSSAPDGPERSAVNLSGRWGGEPVSLTRFANGLEPSAAEAWRGNASVTLVDVRTPARGPWEAGLAFTEWLDPGRTGRTVRIERGRTVTFSPGASLVFEGHSHKSVDSGTESPLMVAVTYRVSGRATSAQVSLFPPHETRWQWQRWSFRLVDHEYGAWMKLEVHELTPRALEVGP